jgi:hypothetical protein
MTAVLWKCFSQTMELVARPVMIRARKSSFTIRVDRMFTASREAAFTNARQCPVETLAIACVCPARNAD